jgi:hypothetical protein
LGFGNLSENNILTGSFHSVSELFREDLDTIGDHLNKRSIAGFFEVGQTMIRSDFDNRNFPLPSFFNNYFAAMLYVGAKQDSEQPFRIFF